MSIFSQQTEERRDKFLLLCRYISPNKGINERIGAIEAILPLHVAHKDGLDQWKLYPLSSRRNNYCSDLWVINATLGNQRKTTHNGNRCNKRLQYCVVVTVQRNMGSLYAVKKSR